MADEHVDDLLQKLSSLKVSRGSKNDGDKSSSLYTSKFKKELDTTKFTLFVPVRDCGYYGWNPMDESYQSLATLQSAEEITRHIDIDQKPEELIPFSQLKVPQPFDMSMPPVEHSNKYPYGQFDIASLHVATKHRNVNLDEVDFIFGGSTLEMLAKQDDSNPYMVCRVPTTTKTILVRKCKEYVQNFADVGFQFERYVTTGSMRCNDSTTESVEHMQLMDIGTKYTVLVCAETDAMDSDGDPLEVKASNPQYWGTKVMFQMISSGSPTLCCGIKGRNTLNKIQMRSLSSVAADALRNRSHAPLERNIMNGMRTLQEKMIDASYGENYKISFDDTGELSLQRAITRNATMLPPDDVVEEILS